MQTIDAKITGGYLRMANSIYKNFSDVIKADMQYRPPKMCKRPWMKTAAINMNNMGLREEQIIKTLKAMRKAKVREDLAVWEAKRQARLQARKERRKCR